MNFYVGESVATPSYRPVNGRIKNIRLDRLFIGLNSTLVELRISLSNGKMQNKFPDKDNFSIFHWFLHFMLVPMV